jgi:hypothetical protein
MKSLYEVRIYFYPRTVIIEAEDAAEAAEMACDGLHDIEDIDVQIKEKDPDSCDAHHLWTDGCPACSKKLRELVEGNQ